MIEALITFLIYACVIALVVYLVIWVLGIIGVALPPKVIQILWVIVALVILLAALRILLPGLGYRIVGDPVKIGEMSCCSTLPS